MTVFVFILFDFFNVTFILDLEEFTFCFNSSSTLLILANLNINLIFGKVFSFVNASRYVIFILNLLHTYDSREKNYLPC